MEKDNVIPFAGKKSKGAKFDKAAIEKLSTEELKRLQQEREIALLDAAIKSSEKIVSDYDLQRIAENCWGLIDEAKREKGVQKRSVLVPTEQLSRLARFTLKPEPDLDEKTRKKRLAALVKNVGGYIARVRSLAEATGENFDSLRLRLFEGTSYRERRPSNLDKETEDALIYVSEMLRSAGEWVVREAGYDSAIARLTKFKLQTPAGGGNFLLSRDNPVIEFDENYGDSWWIPRIRLYRERLGSAPAKIELFKDVGSPIWVDGQVVTWREVWMGLVPFEPHGEIRPAFLTRGLTAVYAAERDIEETEQDHSPSAEQNDLSSQAGGPHEPIKSEWEAEGLDKSQWEEEGFELVLLSTHHFHLDHLEETGEFQGEQWSWHILYADEDAGHFRIKENDYPSLNDEGKYFAPMFFRVEPIDLGSCWDRLLATKIYFPGNVFEEEVTATLLPPHSAGAYIETRLYSQDDHRPRLDESLLKSTKDVVATINERCDAAEIHAEKRRDDLWSLWHAPSTRRDSD